MLKVLTSLFDPSGLTPHGFCLVWQPGLIWLHAVSDGVTAIAYFAIPVALGYFVGKRRDLAFGWVFYVFAAFILACGTSHWMSILTLWVPAYWLEGWVKALTAALSITTAIILWPLIPRALALRSPLELERTNQALRESQKIERRVGQVAGIGGWEIDLADNAVSWSEHTCKLHGMPPGHVPTLEEALGYFSPEWRERAAKSIRAAIETGEPWDIELSLTTAQGVPIWVRSVGSVEFENGRAARLSGAVQDITAYKRLEQEIRDQRELLRVTLQAIGDAVGDAIITTDLDGKVRWLNTVAEGLTRWSRAEAENRPLSRVLTLVDESGAAAERAHLALDTGESFGRDSQAILVARTGRALSVEGSAAPIRNNDGVPIGAIIVFRDVSEQRRLNAELVHRATHDALTGLANRGEFESRLTALLDEAKRGFARHSLLYIDLDQFKLVNDTCGHAIGDQLLKQVAALLSSMVGDSDVVARLGGDEFGVALKDCDAARALSVSQAICGRMEDFRFLHENRRFQIGASIGLVPIDAHWPSAGAVMQAADSSCYAAKEAGRNRVTIWSETDRATRARSQDVHWANRLGQALDEDRFELFGQIIEPLTKAASGLHFEVLIRLREPDGSLSSPAKFMPAAERYHVATRIDRWVVARVCARLRDAGNLAEAIDMVAINLSGQSVADRAFHAYVFDMLRRAAFDVSKLCFEITETAAITNFIDANAFIEEVRALGAKVALDDFGAGSSSFGYLKALHVDFLKIDGQFVTDLLEDPLDSAAVRCFRDVAKVIGVQTIAEFVEREDVRYELIRMGIDMAQGYLVHRPEPLERLLARLRVEEASAIA